MRSDTPRYPVDRYLVESSKNVEMVNIIDDEIWNPEPALRPEDEIILRKLHEMLQSTADDLKMLSGELSKFHEPKVQMKTMPTPLDEDFNEKIHIEEIVNAKFHGYKIVDNLVSQGSSIQQNVIEERRPRFNDIKQPKRSNTQNAGVQVNVPLYKKSNVNKNLSISRTRTVQIDDTKNKSEINDKKVIDFKPSVTYNEFSFKYIEPKVKNTPKKTLQIQEMPSINIRSELKEQKVLQLDIVPDTKNNTEYAINKKNVTVVTMQHEIALPPKQAESTNLGKVNAEHTFVTNKQPIRKVSKMSIYDSSESANNISSDSQHKLKTQRQIRGIIKISPKSVDTNRNKQKSVHKKELEKRSRFNLDDWKRKLNVVYGQPSSSRKGNTAIKTKVNVQKSSSKKSLSSNVRKSMQNVLNNAQYIPYSQLTLGGVRVSDIEREISDIPNKNDIPLSPILDKILNSRENSFHDGSPKKEKDKSSPRIFTTSDENLLEEVIDIERTISKTLSDNVKKEEKSPPKQENVLREECDENDSYDDDFEDEESDKRSINAQEESPEVELKKSSSKPSADENISEADSNEKSSNNENTDHDDNQSKKDHNRTYTKVSNLSLKNSVDIFEFVHSVETQDTATQSNATHKISLKETQTSPRNDKSNLQSIHNDLWPSIDPRGEVEKMFKLEKEFITKLIIDEYGDLIQKPSTSNHGTEQGGEGKNIAASQKNTQTSPAHVKSVMTSPPRTKTRTTSPFTLSLKIDHQTSPLTFVTNEQEFVEIDHEADDLGISINLSSPRFNLRLPQTSHEVLSNFEMYSLKSKVDKKEPQNSTLKKADNKIIDRTFPNIVSTSSDADNSLTDISSVGEVKVKLKRKLRRGRIPCISESSTSSTVSKCSSDIQVDILPLRSEGEISLGQTNSRSKPGKSDGELSLNHL